jgi:hypothetical protein
LVFLLGSRYCERLRHLAGDVPRRLVARGRSAADVATARAFGPSALCTFNVWTDGLDGRGVRRRGALIAGSEATETTEAHTAWGRDADV